MSAHTLYVLAFLLWNICQWMMWFYTIHKLFPPKLPSAAAYGIELFSTVTGVSLLYYLLDDSVVGTLIVPIVTFILPVLLLHRNTAFRKLVVCIAMLFSMVCTESVFSFIFTDVMNTVAQRNFYSLDCILYYIYFLFLQGIFLLLIYFLFHRWNRNLSGYLSVREGWLFLLFPVSQYVLLAGWYMNLKDGFTPSLLLISAVIIAFCTAADLLLFRTLKRNSENAKLRTQNDLLRNELATQSSYYRALAKNYSDMSRLRHDIGNHLFTIQILLQENKGDEAMQYAEELRQSELIQSLLSDCHNTVVSAFLRHKTEDLSADGIALTCNVSLPAHTAISDTDTIIALGNILDNAAEACRQTEHPYIRLQLMYQDHLLHFEAVNSCPDHPQMKKRRIPYLERGLGSGILQALAEKYHGSYRGYPDNDAYHTVLVLKEASDISQ